MARGRLRTLEAWSPVLVHTVWAGSSPPAASSQQPAQLPRSAHLQPPFRLLPLGGTHRGDAVCRQGLWLLLRAGFLSTRELRWPPSFSMNLSPAFQTEKLKFPDQKNPWSRPGNEGSRGLRASGSHLGPAPVRAAGLRGCTPEDSFVLLAHSRAEPASGVGEQRDGKILQLRFRSAG